MGFPLPLPDRCRGYGKRKWEVVGLWRDRDVENSAAGREAGLSRSASRETVSVRGFDNEAGGGHGGEALVESGGADAAGCAQLGEWPRFIPVGESRGDTLINGSRRGTAIRLVMRLLNGPQSKSVIVLSEFERHTGHGGGRAMLDGQDDAIVGVAAEIEVGIAPGVEFR